jgi:hypothetical protein
VLVGPVVSAGWLPLPDVGDDPAPVVESIAAFPPWLPLGLVDASDAEDDWLVALFAPFLLPQPVVSSANATRTTPWAEPIRRL